MGAAVTSPEVQSKKKRQLAFLEPYRGRKGALAAEEGVVGLSMLHELFEGNAVHAGKFLGYQDKAASHLRETWAKFGLRAEGNVRVVNGLDESESVEALRARYRAKTSEKEYAFVTPWKLPVEAEYGICVAVSDLHYGPAEMDYERWLKLRDWIREDKSRRWMYLGDGLDCPTKASPSSRNYLDQFEAERLLEADFGDIAKQCIIVLSGNHEARIARDTGLNLLDPLGRIAEKLEIPYGGMESLVQLRVEQGKRSEAYDGYVHHGISSATTKGGQINSIVRVAQQFEVDFVAMGHTHALLVDELKRICLSRETAIDEATGREVREVVEHDIALCYAGSYLRHKHGSYSRNKGLTPASLGSASLHFYGDHHDVHGRK